MGEAAYIVAGVLDTERALDGPQSVFRRRGRVWKTSIEARRWIIKRGWVTGSKSKPATIYAVDLPDEWDKCTTLERDGVARLSADARVRRFSEGQRQAMLNDPRVVCAAQALAARYSKPYQVGRRLAVHLYSKFKPYDATDLAASINNFATMGVRSEDLANAEAGV